MESELIHILVKHGIIAKTVARHVCQKSIVNELECKYTWIRNEIKIELGPHIC